MMLKNIMPATKKLCNITMRNLLDDYLDFENNVLIFVDLETLGVNPTYECEQITEMAAWSIAGDTLEVVDKLNYKINLLESTRMLLDDPNSVEREGWEYRQSRRGKHAISNPHDVLKMTKYNTIDATPLDEQTALRNLSNFVSRYENQVVVAHNIGFDMKFIMKRSAKYGYDFPCIKALDTLTLSRYFLSPALEVLTEDVSVKKLADELYRETNQRRYISSRLGDLAKSFGINSDNWHTASADVEMLLGVYDKMIRFFEEHSDTDISHKQREIIFRNN